MKTRKDALAFAGSVLLVLGALWWAVRITTNLFEIGNPYADVALEWGEALCNRDYAKLHRLGFRLFGSQPRPVEFDAVIDSYLAFKIGRGQTCYSQIYFPTSHRINPPEIQGVTDTAWLVEVQLKTPDVPTHLFVRVVQMQDGTYYISPDEKGLEAISRWSGLVYREPLSVELFGTYGGRLQLDQPEVLEGQTIWAIGIPYTVQGGALQVNNLSVKAFSAGLMTALNPVDQQIGQINEPPRFSFPVLVNEQRFGTWWFSVPADEAPARVLLEINYDGSTLSIEPVLPPLDRRGALGPYPLSVASAHAEQDAEGNRGAIFTFEVDETLIAPANPFVWECGDFQLRWEEFGLPRNSRPLECFEGETYFAALEGQRTITTFDLAFEAAAANAGGDLDVSLYGIDDWSETPNAFQRLLFEGLVLPAPSGQLDPLPMQVAVEPFAQDAGEGAFVAIFNMEVDLAVIAEGNYFRWSCQNFQLRWEQDGASRTGIAALCPDSGKTYYPGSEREEFRLAMEAPNPQEGIEVTLVFSNDWRASSDAPVITLFEGEIRH